MILTVDIGNTNIKTGAWDEGRLAFVSRMETNIRCTDDEYAIKLLEIFRLYECNRNQFDGAILSSVVPSLSPVISSAISRILQSSRVYHVSEGLETGLSVKIDDPSTLGDDLICAAVGALAKCTLPCIVISLGTAATWFVLNEQGEMLGGAVAPGPLVSLAALSSGTAQLPHIGLGQSGTLIGTNTVDSMQSGIIYGWASMVDGMVDRMREQLGCSVSLIAYGGHGPMILEHCKNEIERDDNLVLEGLRIIYDRNIK